MLLQIIQVFQKKLQIHQENLINSGHSFLLLQIIPVQVISTLIKAFLRFLANSWGKFCSFWPFTFIASDYSGSGYYYVFQSFCKFSNLQGKSWNSGHSPYLVSRRHNYYFIVQILYFLVESSFIIWYILQPNWLYHFLLVKAPSDSILKGWLQ